MGQLIFFYIIGKYLLKFLYIPISNKFYLHNKVNALNLYDKLIICGKNA